MLSPEEIDKAFENVHTLIKEQAWDEAREYIEGLRRQHDLGKHEKDFLLLEASCWRRRGEDRQERARDLYKQLIDQFDPMDVRLADVYEGLADSYMVTGHANTAQVYAEQAARIIEANTEASADLAFRVRQQLANTTSYTDLERSLVLYEELLKDAEATGRPTSAIANLYFQYGNVRFRNGDYETAVQLLRKSLKMAVDAEALKTIADCKRKLALAEVLAGGTDKVLDGLVDLDYARRIYNTIGDRGAAYSYTEQGELLKFLGRYEEARDAYKQSLWQARDLNDNVRIAHSLLGLYELDRVLGERYEATPQDTQIEEAMARYRWQRYQWGAIRCLTSIALTRDRVEARNEQLGYALDVINGSTVARFWRERELIERLQGMSLADGQAERILFNWS